MSNPVTAGDILMSSAEDPEDCDSATWLVVDPPERGLTCIRIDCACQRPLCSEWSNIWSFEENNFLEDDTATYTRLVFENERWMWEIIDG